jgi:hypothetical protein
MALHEGEFKSFAIAYDETLWDPWGLFFIHLNESGISNYKGMNSGGMNLR